MNSPRTETPRLGNPNKASWDCDKASVSRRLPFSEGLDVLPSSAGDKRTSAREVSTMSQGDKPVADDHRQFTPEKTATSQHRSNHSISSTERNSLQNSVKTKDRSSRSEASSPPCMPKTKFPEDLSKRKEQTHTMQAKTDYSVSERNSHQNSGKITGRSNRSGSISPPCTSEAKLPENLIKRKEQTRTVQALIQYIMKENQQGQEVHVCTFNPQFSLTYNSSKLF
jgi:hypothetical protein